MAQRVVWGPCRFHPDAKTCVVGQQAIGVYEGPGPPVPVNLLGGRLVLPGAATSNPGRFVLLDLKDGHKIVDAKVEHSGPVAEIFAYAMGPQYIVVVSYNGPPLPGEPPFSSGGVPGHVPHAIMSGLVYAFDRQGKPMWPAPVKVRRQHLLTDQPAGLPVFTFACQVHRPKGTPPRQEWLPYISILCIDKRTGHVAFCRNVPGIAYAFHLSGDPEKQCVEIGLQLNPPQMPQARGRAAVRTYRLTFTDKPWPARSAAQAEDEWPEEPARAEEPRGRAS